MESEQRYRRVWKFCRWAARGPIQHIFAYTCEPVENLDGPCLVVANHNTDLDPALVGLSFAKQMFFVASEHVFRMGLLSRVLTYLFRPISRVKGATDASAALEIVRELKKGHNVCIFAEGNRSFNGLTGPIFPATGKLARMSGATLVTYRLEGGYLTSPRWSHTLRKGRLFGHGVHVYSPEQLKAMKPDAINEAIREDLMEDAFARQEAQPVPYRGKRLAEGLENALFICPVCGKIGAMAGGGDRFRCTCGMEVRYTEYGTFAGAHAPFPNIRDWDAWQREELERCARDPELTLTDDGIQLVSVGTGHGVEVLAAGTLRMDRTSLTVGDRRMTLTDIGDMALVGRSNIVFSMGETHYEISRAFGDFCGRKYSMLYQIWKESR